MGPRDITCPGTVHLLVSAGGTDRASPDRYTVGRRIDTIQDTTGVERCVVSILGTYERTDMLLSDSQIDHTSCAPLRLRDRKQSTYIVGDYP